MRKISGILAASALIASVVFVAPAAHAQETITSAGSSYMNSFQQTCSALYTNNKVSYGSGGSGAGLTGFKNRTIDWGGTDNPYAAGTAPTFPFTYVPLVSGAIVLAYNIPGVTNLRLTPQLISDIYNGKITSWDAPALKRVNPTAKLPKQKIVPVFRSDSSGTTFNLAEYLRQTTKGGSWVPNNAFATALGKTPIGVGSSGNQQVTATVKATPYSITYADPADAKKNALRFAAVRNGAGEFIVPTSANAGKFIAAQALGDNGIVTFDYKKKIKGAYNAALIAYGIAETASTRPAKAAAVKDYFNFLIKTCGPQRAASGDYVPILGKVRTKALQLIATIK